MNESNAPRPRLEERLLSGVHSEELSALGPLLGMGSDAAEPLLARALVRAVLAQQAAAMRNSKSAAAAPGREDDSRVVEGRASFLMRLTKGGDQAGFDLARLDDLRTLLAVVRAGSLYQRRAAALRIGELLAGAGRFPNDQARHAIDALSRFQAIAIAYEVSLATSRLSGAEGKRARAAGQQWDALSTRFTEAVRSFWDGAVSQSPSSALADEERIQLWLRVRDLPDASVRHLCAVIQGADGVSDLHARVALLGELRYAGDARLLPTLRDIIDSAEDALVVPAVRALSAIEDARAHAALKAAYERTATPEQRLALAGALGVAGDARGLEYVRQVLADGDERLLPYALEALAELGGKDDVQSVLELLERSEPAPLPAVVQTLGRIGDGRAMVPLTALAEQAPSSALRALIEEATESIAARMELLGEEAPAVRVAKHNFDTTKRAALVRRKDPANVRMRARMSLWLGHGWLFLGAPSRAIARFETAAALRPEWVAPVLEIAMAYARRQESAQALAAFRRVLGIERLAVERSAAAVGLLARTFLRRVELIERDGRDDIARGLLEEVLSLDLRRAPSDLRFALEQALASQRAKR